MSGPLRHSHTEQMLRCLSFQVQLQTVDACPFRCSFRPLMPVLSGASSDRRCLFFQVQLQTIDACPFRCSFRPSMPVLSGAASDRCDACPFRCSFRPLRCLSFQVYLQTAMSCSKAEDCCLLCTAEMMDGISGWAGSRRSSL